MCLILKCPPEGGRYKNLSNWSSHIDSAGARNDDIRRFFRSLITPNRGASFPPIIFQIAYFSLGVKNGTPPFGPIFLSIYRRYPMIQELHREDLANSFACLREQHS